MTFDTSYDRHKNYMLYDTFEGQGGVVFVEIFRWSDDRFIVRMMIITENSQDYGPDHLQIDFIIHTSKKDVKIDLKISMLLPSLFTLTVVEYIIAQIQY